VWAVIASVCIWAETSLIYALAYNFPCFADVVNRMWGGEVVEVKVFIERLLAGMLILPIFIRGLIDLIPNETSKGETEYE
jgi:hypothetical protein